MKLNLHAAPLADTALLQEAVQIRRRLERQLHLLDEQPETPASETRYMNLNDDRIELGRLIEDWNNLTRYDYQLLQDIVEKYHIGV